MKLQTSGQVSLDRYDARLVKSAAASDGPSIEEYEGAPGSNWVPSTQFVEQPEQQSEIETNRTSFRNMLGRSAVRLVKIAKAPLDIAEFGIKLAAGLPTSER